MGIKRRMWFLVLGMLLCQLCVGCGKDASGSRNSGEAMEGTQEVQKHTLTQEEVISVSEVLKEQEILETVVTVAPITATPAAAVSPIVSSEEMTPATEIPSTTPDIKGEPGTNPEKATEIHISASKTPTVQSTPVPSPIPVTPIPAVPKPPATEPPTTEMPVTEVPATSVVTAAPQVHTHSIATETKAATCLAAGGVREYCEACGDVVREETFPALGHDFVKSVWELPTCMKGGYYNNVCSRCGQVECVTQEPLPHEVEDIPVQEGNCMEDTVIQHICRMCGLKVKEDTRYTPYDIHSWVTVVEDGEEITYCEWCGVTG